MPRTEEDLEKVNIAEALQYLSQYSDLVNAIENYFRVMISRRQPLKVIGKNCYFPPIIVNCPEADRMDEEMADNCFMELRDSLKNFMRKYKGVRIRL